MNQIPVRNRGVRASTTHQGAESYSVAGSSRSKPTLGFAQLQGADCTSHVAFDAAAHRHHTAWGVSHWYPAFRTGFDVTFGARLTSRPKPAPQIQDSHLARS